jgi:hypothetical protein
VFRMDVPGADGADDETVLDYTSMLIDAVKMQKSAGSEERGAGENLKR